MTRSLPDHRMTTASGIPVADNQNSLSAGPRGPLLLNAIAAGDFPQWDVKVQVATPQQLAEWEARTGWNLFDLTKVWPHGDSPLHPVGVLELNRNPVRPAVPGVHQAPAPAGECATLPFPPPAARWGDGLRSWRRGARHGVRVALGRLGRNVD